LLVVFFFLPWIKIQVSGPAGFSGETSGVLTATVGYASGWQLGVGELELDLEIPFGAEPDKEGLEQFQEEMNAMARARPWFVVGLIVPVFMVILALAVPVGGHRPSSMSKLTIFFAVIGIIILILAATTVDYNEDQIAHRRAERGKVLKQMGTPAAEIEESLDKLEEKQRKLMKQAKERGYGFKTAGRALLWVSLGLYVVAVIACAMGLGAEWRRGQEPVPLPPAGPPQAPQAP
jgi:hypothetical protein